MIHEVTCCMCSCDNCGEDFEAKFSGFSIYTDKEAVMEAATEEGWREEGDKHYCPLCHQIDDEDNLIIHSDKSKTAENSRM